MAYNLWWSWHAAARELFQELDLQAWRENGHNPIRMLALLPQAVLESAASDLTFLAHYDAVMEQFEAETRSQEGWYTAQYGGLPLHWPTFPPSMACTPRCLSRRADWGSWQAVI